MSFSSKFLPASLRLAVQKVRYEWLDAGGCLAVPVRGVPLASSTPRPCGRQLSAGPLLTSVPDGLPAVNSDRASLQTPGRRPLPSQDEASTLACGARTGRARRTPDSVPAEDHSAGIERGLTARPSPLRRRRLPLMGFSSRWPSVGNSVGEGPQPDAEATHSSASVALSCSSAWTEGTSGSGSSVEIR